MGIINRLSFLRRPKSLASFLIIILLIAAVVLAVHNLNAPAVGTISQPPPTKADRAVIKPYSTPGSYSGKYVSYTYPAHYKKVPSQLSGSYLEVDDFYATDHSGKNISIGIVKEALASDSGLRLRQSEPEIYQQQPRTRGGAVIFTSTANGSEQTAFIQHGDKLATVSVTAPAGWDLTNDLQTVLTSLKWK